MRWIVAGFVVTAATLWAAPAQFIVSLTYPAAEFNPVSVNINGADHNALYGGTLTFTMDGQPIQSTFGPVGPFTGGGTWGFNYQPLGPHRLGIVYSGDGTYEASVTYFDFVVVPRKQSSISAPVADPPNPLPGQPVTLTSTVMIEQEQYAFGTVRFYEGQTLLGAAIADGAKASLTIALGQGSHSIRAEYFPSTIFLPSFSAALQLFVGSRTTSISMPVAQGGTRFGQAMHLSAVIAPVPVGEISFHAGARTLGAAPVNHTGAASVSLADLGVGLHSITARYAGGPGFEPATSPTLMHRVQGTPTISLASSANPLSPGSALIVTVTLTKPSLDSIAPSGVLTLRKDATLLGSAVVNNGTAHFALPPGTLPPGEHRLTASYAGDEFYDAVTSSPFMQRIAGHASQVSTRVLLSNSVTVGVAVTSAGALTPTGNVRMSGAGQTLTRELAGGSASFENVHVLLGRRVAVEYLGDSLHTASAVGNPVVIAPLNGFSFGFTPLAPNEIVTVFGEALGTNPTVQVTPQGGSAKKASLYFASPTQLTLVMPDGIADGTATLAIHNGMGETHTAEIAIVRTAPGIATANANGQGDPAAQVLRVRGGVSTIENFGPLAFHGDSLYLVLYGTGFRHAASPVTCTAAGRTMTAAFAGAQGGFPGLDQINLPLDASLAGTGQVTLMCAADGRVSNAVTLAFP